MKSEIFVIKETYEKNATDGISYFTSRDELAEAVYQAESCGAHVQVYKCVPVDHEVRHLRLMIDLHDNS